MNTKILMTASSIFLGILGLGLTFLPEETSNYFNGNLDQWFILFLQLTGSLYLAFAMLDWMNRTSLLGGIYGRPIVTGNLIHYLVSGIALIKLLGKYDENGYEVILTLSIIYCAFTLCFIYVFLNNPKELDLSKK